MVERDEGWSEERRGVGRGVGRVREWGGERGVEGREGQGGACRRQFRVAVGCLPFDFEQSDEKISKKRNFHKNHLG